MECDRQNCFSFWAIFYPFNPTNNLKNQNEKKKKKRKKQQLEICGKNNNHFD